MTYQPGQWQRRANARQPPSMIGCTIENPAHGKLWQTEFVRLFATQTRAQSATTTYCKYGGSIPKPTRFLHNFSHELELASVCSARNPCRLRENNVHTDKFVDLTQRERNSIPSALIRQLHSACISSAKGVNASSILVVDVFSGWGSLNCVSTPNETTMPTYVYSNDIAKGRRCDMDVDMSVFDIYYLVGMALLKMVEWLDKQTDQLLVDQAQVLQNHLQHPGRSLTQIATDSKLYIWIHMSVPCTTYSTMSGATHRTAGSCLPISQLALNHDTMIEKLLVDTYNLIKPQLPI